MRFLLLLLLATSATFAQQVSLTQFKNWKPRNIGPAGMSGRVTTVDVVRNAPETWVIGAASGGVWKTTNAGASWQPLFDEQPTLNIGSVSIQQSNPNIIWVGTGEGNPRNSLNIGEGIYKTMDGGKTWRRMGLENTRNIHRIIIDPTNPNVVYAGVIGNPYAEHPERGVYKTTDGGETWNRILFTNESSGVGDMVMDPSNPNKILVNMWQHRRTPYSFKSGGPGSGLYITYNGGKDWKKLGQTDGLAAGEYGRMGLAFAPSQPSRVYAMIEATKNGFYKSDDGGTKWELITAEPRIVTNRPFYFQDIAVDSKNENRVYSIHDIVEVSEDGGKTFRTLLPYSGVHPDHHAWYIHPDNPNFILEGNDGGIAFSRDKGANWNFDDKLPFGQFYHVNVDNEMPYNIMGGLQDNGSWHGPAYSWTNGGLRNYYWNNVGGGDGFDVMPDPEDASWVYSMSQGGNLGRINYKTGERWFTKPASTDTAQKLRFNWNAGIAQDPFDKKTIYYGSQFLHKSTDKGASWTIISPDLTTNNKEQQKQDDNGGLTLDVTGAENYNSILAIAPSPKDAGVIWVGTDDGNVQLTRDGGKSWTNFRGRIPGLPVGAWVPQVRASTYNAGEAFVVANDYRRGDFKPYIFRTTDYGRTWTNMVDEKKVKGYALTVLQDPAQPNLIFAGTEHGLWVSFDDGASFQQWTAGYPNVSTYDLAIQEREADLAVATFGRSLWVMDDIRPLRALAQTKGNIGSTKLKVFPANDAYQANYRASTGYEWSVAGLYEGENRRRGAEISYYIAPQVLPKPAAAITPVKKGNREGAAMAEDSGRVNAAAPATTPTTTPTPKMDSVTVKIYNAQGENIRNLKWKADTGFNRQWWGMEEKGYRAPGSPKPRPGAAEPGGLQVFPGTYKVVVSLAGASDSTMVTVKDDPRLQKSEEAKRAQRQMLQRLRMATDKLTLATDRLSDFEEVLGKMQNDLRGMEGKEADSLRKATTAVQDSVKALRAFINGKPSERQGLSRDNSGTVMSYIQTAQSYIVSKSVAPGAQEEALVKNAETAIASLVQKVNNFTANQWKNYRMKMEASKLSLFKDYTPIQ